MNKCASILIIAVLLLSLGVASTAAPAQAGGNGNAFGRDKDIERVDFIHYAKPSGNAGGKKAPTCYKLMGVKWANLPVGYVINPANPNGLGSDYVTSTIASSAETWDAATSKELFGDAYSIDYGARYGVLDYRNVIAFGDYPTNGVIGVTSVWYSRASKRIVEFDMMLDTDYIWGDADVDPTVMDLQNIVTHEFGHAVGLSDLYTSSCSAVTMYGYSGEGETIKRTLETADITGLQKMYGA